MKTLTVVELHQQARAEGDLLVWTIYDRPKDFPDRCVLRPARTKGGARPLGCHITFDHAQLPLARSALQNLGCVCLGRDEHDDPCILESWI
jgi:hypothetical protein